MPNGTSDVIDQMIDEMKIINKAIIALREENTLLKKEIVRLQWMLEEQD